MKKSLFLILLLIEFINLSGQSCSLDSLKVRSIKAIHTDTNINWELQNHQVFINQDCFQNDKLIIHLVGSFDNPSSTTYFPSLAANNGFKVINLKYPNGTAAVSACANSSDTNCFGKFRQEIIFGVDSSASVDVDTFNCIKNRIEKLLMYLESQFPLENWSNYVDPSGNIIWSNIIVSGHSQGGGHAAFIAKQFVVNRALMFASPNDYSDYFTASANWLSNPSATALSNYFAFGNLYDDIVDYSKQFNNYITMNLLTQSDSTNVDYSVCNYNNSTILYTQIDSANVFSGNHNSVIIDNYTPLVAGEPVFAPVWEYMLDICDVTTNTIETSDLISDINIYPNPAISEVQIESKTKILKIKVYDICGTLLKTVYPNHEYFRLNIESNKGVLFLKLILLESNSEVFKKIIVE